MLPIEVLLEWVKDGQDRCFSVSRPTQKSWLITAYLNSPRWHRRMKMIIYDDMIQDAVEGSVEQSLREKLLEVDKTS